MENGTINTENKKYNSRSVIKKRRAARNKAHRDLERKLGRNITTDVDHIRPLSKGGSNRLSNLRILSNSRNRSFKRKKDGSMA